MAAWACQPAITYDTRPAWNNTQQLQLQPRHHGAMNHRHGNAHPQRSRNHVHTCSAYRPRHHHHNPTAAETANANASALIAVTGDYVARRLVPQLQRGSPSRPVALYMNYGTMVLPSDRITTATSNNANTTSTTAANAVLFNAPGSTMILTSPTPASRRRRYANRDGAVYNAHVADQQAVVPVVHNNNSNSNYVVAGRGQGRVHRAGDAVLASCPGCGLLRTTSGGYCRDCDLGMVMAGNGRRQGGKGFWGN